MRIRHFLYLVLSLVLALAPVSAASSNPNSAGNKGASANSNAGGNSTKPSTTPAPAPKKAEVDAVKVTETTGKGNGNSTTTPGNPNQNIDSNSTSEKTNPGQDKKDAVVAQREIVSPSQFKNDKLVAGKFGINKINEEADQIKFAESDEECGVDDTKAKAANTKANTNANVSASAAASSKAPAAASKSTASKSNNSAAASAKANVAAKKAEKEECIDYLVVFKSGTTVSDMDKTANGVGGSTIRKFHNAVKAAIINGPPSKMQALIGKNPNVRSVELDGQVVTQGVQSDSPWGLDRIDQNQLPLSSSYDDKDVTGFSIPVYVVDTGIYAAHTEFNGRVTAGFTAISDGRGSADCNGHGTHVAGTIGGSTYGAAKQATLIPVRVLDCAGSGSYSSVIAGLDWIAANHPAGVPAVVNMSLGGAASNTVDAAVRGVISKGITVVVAAGNSNADACNSSPARVKEAITIGASTSGDSRASFSNYGSCVDLFAPGASITSAWITSTTSSAVASGTSMAAPHVAGTIARFLVNNSSIAPYNAEQSVIKGATSGVLTSIGTGSPNLLLFTEFSADTSTAPSAPSDSDDGSGSTTQPGKTTAPGQSKKPKR